jgi:hypothetical protein
VTDNPLHDSQSHQNKLKIQYSPDDHASKGKPSESHKLKIAVHHRDHKIAIRQQDAHQMVPGKPSQKAMNRRTVLILVNLGVVILLGAVLLGIFLKSNNDAKRREMLIAQARARAMLEAEDSCRKIEKARSAFPGINARLAMYMTECSNTVALMPGGIPEVTQTAPRRLAPPPEVAVPALAAPAKPAEPPPEAAATPAKDPAPAAPEPPVTVAPPEKEDPSRPFGEPSREELERKRKTDDSPAPEPAAPPAVKASSDPSAPFGEPSREELERRRKIEASHALAAPAATEPVPMPAAPVFSGPPAQAALVAAREHEAGITGRNEELKELVGQGEALLAEAKQKTRPEDVEASAARLREMVISAQQAVTAAEAALTAIQEKLKEIRTLYAAFKEDQKKLELQRAAQQKKEEREALIQREHGSAVAAAAATKTFFREGSYTQAVEKLTAAMGQLTTAEARQVLQTKIERFLMLRDLRNFLVEQMNKGTFTWGWGNGPTARDVNGADDKYIRIRGGRVLWTDADPAQMAKFIDHYSVDPKLQREIKARQFLAAAIYFNEAGLDEQAEAYRAKALAANRVLQALADRLLPPR